MDAQIWNYRLKTKSGSLNTQRTAHVLKKVIIVGHPQSGYGEVEQILINSGMKPALPALKEGLSAQQISRQLCNAHGIPPIDTLCMGEADEIQQLEVNPIWHALVLDLVRGNLNQNFWGWADSSTIFLLDFWKSVFPDVTFVLVYNHPRTALRDIENEWEDLHDEAVTPGDLLESWRVYNDALLTFYEQNRERCLLVHAEQLQKAPSRILNQLQTVLGKPTVPPSEIVESSKYDPFEESTDLGSIDGFSASYSESPPPIRLSLFARQKGRDSLMPSDDDGTANPLELYLANALLNHYTEVKNLYEKIQATALIPHRERVNSEIGINMVWNTFHEMLTANFKLSGENLKFQQDMDATSKELSHTRRLINEKQTENRLLLQKGQQLEEDLGCTNLEIEQLQIKISNLQKAEQKSRANLAEINTLRNQINNLSQAVSQKEEQLKRTQDAKRKMEQELEEENQLLLKQLHLVQEELEKYYGENKNKEFQISVKNKKYKEMELRVLSEKVELQQQCQLLQDNLKKHTLELADRKKEIETLRANQKPVFTGAKQRQRTELVYQIGFTMVQLSRSFIKWKLLFYPLFLRKFLKNYICESQPMEQWFPPLSEYQDYQEAVKAQTHLSYRLGLTWQKHQPNKIGAYFITTWALLGTYGRWKKERDRDISHLNSNRTRDVSS